MTDERGFAGAPAAVRADRWLVGAALHGVESRSCTVGGDSDTRRATSTGAPAVAAGPADVQDQCAVRDEPPVIGVLPL
jgi:hypothetical protein